MLGTVLRIRHLLSFPPLHRNQEDGIRGGAVSDSLEDSGVSCVLVMAIDLCMKWRFGVRV
jgi:hypothetical protein